jgi:hypothetical protein
LFSACRIVAVAIKDHLKLHNDQIEFVSIVHALNNSVLMATADSYMPVVIQSRPNNGFNALASLQTISKIFE